MGLWIHRNTQMWSVALRVSEPKGGNIQGHGRIITQQSIAPSTVQRAGGTHELWFESEMETVEEKWNFLWRLFVNSDSLLESNKGTQVCLWFLLSFFACLSPHYHFPLPAGSGSWISLSHTDPGTLGLFPQDNCAEAAFLGLIPVLTIIIPAKFT